MNYHSDIYTRADRHAHGTLRNVAIYTIAPGTIPRSSARSNDRNVRLGRILDLTLTRLLLSTDRSTSDEIRGERNIGRTLVVLSHLHAE